MPYTFNPFTGNFDSAPSVPAVEGVYLPLSGGTVTGNLSVEGNFEVGSSLATVTMILSGNRVGINTEFPNEELTVVGDISATGGLSVGTGTTTLYVENSLVGINTEFPNEELTVVGDISASNVVYASGGNSNIWNESYSLIQSNSATNWNYQGTDLKALSSNWESTYTTFRDASSTFLTSETDSQTLSFDEGTKDLTISNGNTVSLSGITVTGEYLPLSGGTVTGNLSVEGSFEVGINANATIYVENTLVGINTETPNEELTVVGDISATGGLSIGSSTGPTTLYVENSLVGINTETPNEELTVVGDISASSIIYADGGNSVIWNESYSLIQSNSATWVNGISAEKVLARVYNAESGITMTTGDVVYTFGATGDVMSVKIAYNASDLTSARTLGFVNETIAPGGIGYVVIAGQIEKMSLPHQTYAEGDALWLGSTPGSFTNIKPIAPQHGVYLGVVERANNGDGLVYVKVQNGYELDELHDVSIASVSAGQVLRRNSTNNLWINTDDGSNWDSVYTTVTAASANWQNTYTDFSTNSATYVKTVATTTPGTSAITTIVAVSALPPTQVPGTLYILI